MTIIELYRMMRSDDVEEVAFRMNRSEETLYPLMSVRFRTANKELTKHFRPHPSEVSMFAAAFERMTEEWRAAEAPRLEKGRP